MARGGKAGRNSGVTIIRREEVVAGGHHGGAWKVAYADFVTAMMAFFLLMWLLNATTEDQRKGLADYFSPNNLMSHASSGTGQPFGGHTVFDHGAMVSDRGAAQVIVGMRPVVQDPPEEESDTPLVDDAHGAAAQSGPAGKTDAASPGSAKAKPTTPQAANHGAVGAGGVASTRATNAGAGGAGAISAGAASAAATSHFTASPGAIGLVAAKPADGAKPALVVARVETQSGTRAPTEADLRAAEAAREKQAFEAAAEQIRQAVRGDPALTELSRQLVIDITPEGLRIQLLDEERLPMFATGSAAPNGRAGLLLAKVAPVLMRLPEDIAVVGHTDAAAYTGNGKSNWELSTERANATRRLLTDAGLAETRVSRVTGLADRDPLLPAEPLAAANRRIAIIVLRGTEKLAEPNSTQSVPPSIAAPIPSSIPSSVSQSAASFVPPSVSVPTLPRAAPPARLLSLPSASPSTPPSIPLPALPSTPPSAPPSAPRSISASAPAAAPPSIPVSAPSSTSPVAAPSAAPSESEPDPDPAPAPPFSPPFVPSFVPSFAPSSRPPSAAAPTPAQQPP